MELQEETQSRVQVIAQTLGETTLQNWRERMKEGVIVDLQIKRWRGRKRLDLDDLGIAPTELKTEQAYRELLKLGSKLLLPQEVVGQLDSIERYARQVLAKYAFNTPFGYFMPYSTYSTWREENERWRIQYFALRDEIVEQYPQIVEKLLSQYAPIGRHSYQLLLSHAPDLLDRRGLRSEDAFLIYFQDEIRSAINAPEQIAASFLYEANLKKIDLPDVLAPQSQHIKDVQVEEEALAQQQERLEALEREREARKEVEAREQAEQQREMMMLRMNMDLVQSAQRRKEQLVEQFFGSLMSQVRGLTYDVATDVLASIKKQDGETVRGRSVMQLRNLVTQVKSLNFYGDRDVESMMTRLQVVVDQEPKDRDVGDIARQLRAIALVTRRTLIELGEEVRSERERDINIPDLPSPEDVREARLELDLPALVDLDHSLRGEREETETPVLHVDADMMFRSERM